jgi:elongator complex protein 3
MIVRTPLKKRMGNFVFTLYMKPYECGGQCLYCFTDKGMPRSSLVHEDTLRAEALNWNAKSQLIAHFQRFSLSSNQGYKIGINIMGGSFPNYPTEYINSYMKDIYDAINDEDSHSLEEAIDKQKYAKIKIIYIMAQSLPNHIDNDRCLFLKSVGISEIQLGVQSINNAILELNRRCD